MNFASAASHESRTLRQRQGVLIWELTQRNLPPHPRQACYASAGLTEAATPILVLLPRVAPHIVSPPEGAAAAASLPSDLCREARSALSLCLSFVSPSSMLRSVQPLRHASTHPRRGAPRRLSLVATRERLALERAGRRPLEPTRAERAAPAPNRLLPVAAPCGWTGTRWSRTPAGRTRSRRERMPSSGKERRTPGSSGAGR